MSVTQIAIAAALGAIAGEGALYGVQRFVRWLWRDGWRRGADAAPGRPTALIQGFIRYAAPLATAAGVVLLGVWAVSDYLSARSARALALGSGADLTAPVTETQGMPAENGAPAPPRPPPAAGAPAAADPYADPDFKVRRRRQRAGAAPNLADALLRRSERRARTDLLLEIRRHQRRSQYDCEAAARAVRYLDAGLDVWGFAAWEAKYFPVQGYAGATLPRCKDIDSVVDTAMPDRSTIAQRDRR